MLQTAITNDYVSNKSESSTFGLLFDSGAQLSYVSPKLRTFLNPEIKAKKIVVLKTFGENASNKTLDIAEWVVALKTADKGIKL